MKLFSIAMALIVAMALSMSVSIAPAEARKAGARSGGFGMSNAGRAIGGNIRSRSVGQRAFRGSVGGGSKFKYRGSPRIKQGFSGSKRAWKGPRPGYRHHKHKHRRVVRIPRYTGYGWGSSAYYGGYYDAYPAYGYGDCEWLYRNAVRTDSRYWWRRFEDCMGY